MTGLKNISICFILITLFLACQEVYYPDDIDSTQQIPVIEGYINDGAGPYMVELFWATAFDGGKNEPIKDARVTISDNFGNSTVLTEAGNGRYLSNTQDIIGTPGRLYALRVEFEDGSIYESTPTLMHPPEEIDTVYAEIGEKEYVSKNYSGELMINIREGLHVFFDLNDDSDDKRFFRLSNRLVTQTYHYVYVPTYPDSLDSNIVVFEPVIVYCWTKSGLDELINIKSTFNTITGQVIKRHNLGFLPYNYSPFWQDSFTTPKTPDGWIVTTSAYSITEDAYDYYNSVIKQITAEERIFDPVPSQIKGNIHCISDTTKIVLGLFEVASRTVKHTAFNWSPLKDEYDILNLPEYSAPLSNSCQDSIMPEFWITF